MKVPKWILSSFQAVQRQLLVQMDDNKGKHQLSLYLIT